jgi:hypothetical protein
MQALIGTRQDGSLDMHFDKEATQAVFASVVFAARYHEALAPIARIAEEGLLNIKSRPARRGPEPCQ